MLVVTLLSAAAVGWLSASLPPDAFFSGDPGLKLIAALNAIEHPARPFETDLPKLAGRPVAYVDPMVRVHNGHGHVLQSPVFPVVTAPLLAAFGLRGAYILPAAAFVVLVPLLNSIRARIVPETSFAVLAWITVAANPLLFYSLEFWEHSPAVALLAASTAAVLRDCLPGRRSIVAAGGALAGASILLRPEAAWYVAGLAIVGVRRQWLAFGSGVAAVIVPFSVFNYLHSGSALGPHASSNLAPLANAFFDARRQRIVAWLWPHSSVGAIGLLLVGAAWISGLFKLELRTRQLIGLSGVGVICFLSARGLLPRESFWAGFPLALLALVPTSPVGNAHARHLYMLAAITALGVIGTATHDGGAQWGARFLLAAAPPLIVLAARSASEALRPGRGRTIRVVLVMLILVGGLATSRAAYRELRGAKRDYAHLVSTVTSLTSQGDVILTNVWWFDQILASLHGNRVFLYAPNRSAAVNAMADLSTSGIREVSLVWSSEDDGQSLAEAVNQSCFRILTVREIPLRKLRIAPARCQLE